MQDIIAWRVFAPWSNDLMVEQDYLLCKAVALLFTDPKLSKQLAMRGGTVLHKGHLAPASRYSEDIDLVLISDRSHKGIRQDIAAALFPLLGKPTESIMTTVTLAVRNLASKSKIARIIYIYGPTDPAAAQAQLKIEVNLNEKERIYPLSDVTIDVPSPAGAIKLPVVSYDLNEMMGTKLRALVQRDHGRDLYDAWHAWFATQGAGQLDPAKVGAAFRFYMEQEGSDFGRADFADELARRMKSSKFLSDMNNYLPVGQTYDPQIAYSDF